MNKNPSYSASDRANKNALVKMRLLLLLQVLQLIIFLCFRGFGVTKLVTKAESITKKLLQKTNLLQAQLVNNPLFIGLLARRNTCNHCNQNISHLQIEA